MASFLVRREECMQRCHPFGCRSEGFRQSKTNKPLFSTNLLKDFVCSTPYHHFFLHWAVRWIEVLVFFPLCFVLMSSSLSSSLSSSSQSSFPPHILLLLLLLLLFPFQLLLNQNTIPKNSRKHRYHAIANNRVAV
jgi:hypothetical protein